MDGTRREQTFTVAGPFLTVGDLRDLLSRVANAPNVAPVKIKVTGPSNVAGRHAPSTVSVSVTLPIDNV